MKLEYILNKGKVKDLKKDLEVWKNKYKFNTGEYMTKLMINYEIDRDQLEWNHYVYLESKK